MITKQEEQRKLVKEFAVSYNLWLAFKDKASSMNLNKDAAIVKLLQLFVSGKLDLLL